MTSSTPGGRQVSIGGALLRKVNFSQSKHDRIVPTADPSKLKECCIL